jgi:hypothetical protein
MSAILTHLPFSKVFSLVAFARRPLRLNELREAIGILDSQTLDLDKDKVLFPRYLRKLCAPLIKIGDDEEGTHDDTCRLVHSTVKEFLRESQGKVFGQESDLIITPTIAADACLKYLRQARYAHLLTRHDDGRHGLDIMGDRVPDNHQFLLYAAKYWDRHLDDVEANDETRSLVTDFATSTNFQTLLQVQSLYLEGRFNTFKAYGWGDQKFLIRVFPIWFTEGVPELDIRVSYRQFVHEWMHFLGCSECGDRRCSAVRFAGEIDRCWWSALGPRNLLSKFKGRHDSFCFSSPEVESGDYKIGECFEGVGPTGDELKILRLTYAYLFSALQLEVD